MRSLLVALPVVSLIVALSFGAINVELLANASVTSPTAGDLVAGTGTSDLVLAPGQTAIIRGFFVGNGAGVCGIGGNVIASPIEGDAAITSSDFAYLGSFSGIPVIYDDPNVEEPPVPIPGHSYPVPDTQGAYRLIGSTQSWSPPSTAYAATSYKGLFSYTITAGNTPGKVRLSWSETLVDASQGDVYMFFYTCTTSSVRGLESNTGMTVTVTPEPTTIALLALGSLLIVPRRHAWPKGPRDWCAAAGCKHAHQEAATKLPVAAFS